MKNKHFMRNRTHLVACTRMLGVAPTFYVDKANNGQKLNFQLREV